VELSILQYALSYEQMNEYSAICPFQWITNFCH